MLPADPEFIAADIQTIARNNANCQNCPDEIEIKDIFNNRVTLFPKTKTMKAKSFHKTRLISFKYIPIDYEIIELIVEDINEIVLMALFNWEFFSVKRKIVLRTMVAPADTKTIVRIAQMRENNNKFEFESLI